MYEMSVSQKQTLEIVKVLFRGADILILEDVYKRQVYQGDTEEAITDGYFSESTLRSAPYFSLRIDGITEDADPVA